MSYSKSFAICFYATSAVVALVLSVGCGAWVFGGPLGLAAGMVLGFIPAMLIVLLGFPVTVPALLFAARLLEQKSARKPA